eukprot:TRINITY_DN16938_c0_g1_i1.p1 TRINITY_DN16938_c0_g1~~TRINITY_DN16938_c0_g1_i1.p1  ORF type:complete len:327 (+),score=80.87 TRINITY_DN16938_c0_g1_i1:47-982(+)
MVASFHCNRDRFTKKTFPVTVKVMDGKAMGFTKAVLKGVAKALWMTVETIQQEKRGVALSVGSATVQNVWYSEKKEKNPRVITNLEVTCKDKTLFKSRSVYPDKGCSELETERDEDFPKPDGALEWTDILEGGKGDLYSFSELHPVTEARPFKKSEETARQVSKLDTPSHPLAADPTKYYEVDAKDVLYDALSGSREQLRYKHGVNSVFSHSSSSFSSGGDTTYITEGVQNDVLKRFTETVDESLHSLLLLVHDDLEDLTFATSHEGHADGRLNADVTFSLTLYHSKTGDNKVHPSSHSVKVTTQKKKGWW